MVDGGDFFHRSGAAKEPESIANWLEMERLGYSAITLGPQEFKQLALIDTLRAHTSVPVICTNVERKVGDDWVPLTEPYRVQEINGVQVGFLSVIDEIQLNQSTIRDAGDNLRVLPPMETTRRVAAELREKADVVVLLAHVDSRTMEQYASTLKDVDVVLGGHVTRNDEAPLMMGKSIINRSGTRGQHLAVTRLIVSPEDEIVDFGGVNVTLTKDFPEDPDVASRAEQAEAESKRRRQDQIRQQQEQRRAAQQREEGAS